MRDSDEDLPIVLSFDFRIFFNSPLTSVNLLKNDLGDALEALSAAFEKSSTLKSLCGLAAFTAPHFSGSARSSDEAVCWPERRNLPLPCAWPRPPETPSGPPRRRRT